MSTTEKVPVYEKMIKCNNCGNTMSIEYKWRFDRKCEVCGKEGCIKCMNMFEKSDIHCYHIDCSKNLKGNIENRPYYGENQVLDRDEIVFGKKYKIHYESGETEIIIARGFHSVQFYGDMLDYDTKKRTDLSNYLSHVGITSPYSGDRSWEENRWLEKLKD